MLFQWENVALQKASFVDRVFDQYKTESCLRRVQLSSEYVSACFEVGAAFVLKSGCQFVVGDHSACEIEEKSGVWCLR